MSFPLFKFNTTVQSVSFQTKSTKLATRLMDGRRQKLWMANYGGQIMEVKLWQTNYDGKLWKKNVMANYAGQYVEGKLWKTTNIMDDK